MEKMYGNLHGGRDAFIDERRRERKRTSLRNKGVRGHSYSARVPYTSDEKVTEILNKRYARVPVYLRKQFRNFNMTEPEIKVYLQRMKTFDGLKDLYHNFGDAGVYSYLRAKYPHRITRHPLPVPPMPDDVALLLPHKTHMQNMRRTNWDLADFARRSAPPQPAPPPPRQNAPPAAAAVAAAAAAAARRRRRSRRNAPAAHAAADSDDSDDDDDALLDSGDDAPVAARRRRSRRNADDGNAAAAAAAAAAPPPPPPAPAENSVPPVRIRITLANDDEQMPNTVSTVPVNLPPIMLPEMEIDPEGTNEVLIPGTPDESIPVEPMNPPRQRRRQTTQRRRQTTQPTEPSNNYFLRRQETNEGPSGQNKGSSRKNKQSSRNNRK